MIHEVKIRERWFDRVAADEKRAIVVTHDRDYQAGDTLRLVSVNTYGNPIRRFVERDDRGRFMNDYVADEPVTAVVTHVQPGTQAEGVDDGCCLLSVEVRHDG